MALVDIEQWRAERGFNGPVGQGAPISNTPPGPAPQDPGSDAQLEAMAQEIARQADLIRALQGALREYVDREEQAKLRAMNAARTGKTANVRRRPRKPPVAAPTPAKSV
jgi:hypothetical protein